MSDQQPAPALSSALRFVRMSGIFYCPSELTEPWGLELPPMDDCLWFHVVTSGSCTLQVDDRDPVDLLPGDFVLVPHGSGHRAWGDTPAPTPSVLDLPHDELSDTYGVLRHGGGGAVTNVVCGGVRFTHPSVRHLISSLPQIIHIEGSRAPRNDWMRATLDLMAEETRQLQPGSEAVISRLCDILVIQAIRSWIDHDEAAQSGWLGALRDPQIGAAIAAVHADPSLDWTVATLADAAAMSRSAFAARFTQLVGEPAMAFVTRWRMYTALDLLETTDMTVAAVGQEVGYDSEAAFSRAFKRVLGQSPRTASRAGTPATV